MQRFKTNKYFQPHKLFLLLLALTVLLPAGGAFGQEKKKKKKKTKYFELRVGLAMVYDDNILKYSEKYLNRFMNGEDEGRFHIETYDDLIINPSLEVICRPKIFKKAKTRINASISPKIYAVNNIKDWLYWGVGFQQYITKSASIKILYSYIPDFYVRHFRDDQMIPIYGYTPESFTPYAFSKDNYGIYAQNTFFKGTRIRLSLYHARYYHNKYYTEYDSKDWLYGINLYQRIHKNFRLDFAYQYVTSDAKGYDASIDTPETTTGPDATFAEDRFTIGFVWKLPKLAKRSNNLDVDFLLLNRYYSSPYSPLVDKLHAGRYDKNYRIYATYNITLKKYLKLSLFYNWLMRDTDTKALINSDYVSSEKDYHENKIGFKLVYNLKF
ncbi:MAG: hypothetical protein B6D64_11860 [Bacteroidetes bacterium 4484_276]|nr:MAG: hypothetical protein B6D64_11860 [Bacteroidetes bacterium 4484_276]